MTILRPRQQRMVDAAIKKLDEVGNTLCVAPTGAGKTIMLSAIAAHYLRGKDAKACVLAHREELTYQNRDKFEKMNPDISTAFFNQKEKWFEPQAIFAMMQSLSNSLEDIPFFDLLIIDEAHHVAAITYQAIIKQAQKINPQVKILGMTATPSRGDRKGLKPFTNVCDMVTIEELIFSGHLVPPKTFVIDLEKLEKKEEEEEKEKEEEENFEKNNSAEKRFMTLLAKCEAIPKKWKKHAGGRQTVAFCNTIEESKALSHAFSLEGVEAEHIDGTMSYPERQSTYSLYNSKIFNVLTNVNVLTEGWDHPPTSCVAIWKERVSKAQYIQMVGRGLRIAPVEEKKVDCIILDFGLSSEIHGNLRPHVKLLEQEKEEEKTKECPNCHTEIPLYVKQCPICDFEFEEGEEEPLIEKDIRYLSEEEFTMKQIEMIVLQSRFRWINHEDNIPLNKSDDHWDLQIIDEEKNIFSISMINGFDHFAILLKGKTLCFAFGKHKKTNESLINLGRGDIAVCMAACEDFLNEHEENEYSFKASKWMKGTATPKQINFINSHNFHIKIDEEIASLDLTAYKASCLISLNSIARKLSSIAKKEMALLVKDGLE